MGLNKFHFAFATEQYAIVSLLILLPIDTDVMSLSALN